MTLSEPKLAELRIWVCEDCIRREPGECHAPGCFYRMHSVKDVPTNLDVYVIPPAHVVSDLDAAAEAAHAAMFEGDLADGIERELWRNVVCAVWAKHPAHPPAKHVVMPVDEMERLKAEIAQLRAKLAETDGHRAVLAERCYRKDLELDELRLGGAS